MTQFQIPLTMYYHSSDKKFLPKKIKFLFQAQLKSSPPSTLCESK